MCSGLGTVDSGCILFDCYWCCSLLSFVTVSGHVSDDATVTADASVGVSPFPLSYLPFGGCVGFVRQVEDCRPLSRPLPPPLLLFIPLPRPPIFPEGLSELEVAKLLAVSGGVIAIRVKRTFVTLQVGVVLSVFLSCL